MIDLYLCYVLYEFVCCYVQVVDWCDWFCFIVFFIVDVMLVGFGFCFDDCDVIVVGMCVIECYDVIQYYVYNQFVMFDGGEVDVEIYGVVCYMYVCDGVKCKFDWGLCYCDCCVFDGDMWCFVVCMLYVDWLQDLLLEG